jgi:protein TonB
MTTRGWALGLSLVVTAAWSTSSLSEPPPFPDGIGNVPRRPEPPPWPEGIDIVKDVHRLHAPTASDVERVYPRDAIASETSGRVILRCQFGDAGALARCGVAAEAPKNRGFGTAAMKIASVFRYELNDVDGRPVAGRAMDVDVIFRIQ